MSELPNLPTQSERLRFARERAGFATAAAAAAQFDWNANTYKSHENGLRVKRGLSERVLKKYARAFNVSLSWLATGSSAKHPDGLELVQTKPIIIRGVVEAGRWQEAFDIAFEADPELIETVPVYPSPGYERASLYGLRVRGRSMDLVYPEGTIVIVCPTSETDFRDRDRVVVIRRRNGFAEATVKLLEQTETGWILRAESTDPSFAEPIRFTDEEDDNPEIIGVVVGSYRQERRPPTPFRR